jgi:hypothetical protein
VVFPFGGAPLEIAAAVILALVSGSALVLYSYVFQPRSLARVRRLVMLAVLGRRAAAGSKLFLSIVFADQGRRYLPYLLALAAAPDAGGDPAGDGAWAWRWRRCCRCSPSS